MDYKKVLMEAVNAVLPPACPMCGKPAPFVGGIRADICGSCMHNINYVSEPACLKCGKPVKDEETEYCSDFQDTPAFSLLRDTPGRLLSLSFVFPAAG